MKIGSIPSKPDSQEKNPERAGNQLEADFTEKNGWFRDRAPGYGAISVLGEKKKKGAGWGKARGKKKTY